jgi:hypothetical protein
MRAGFCSLGLVGWLDLMQVVQLLPARRFAEEPGNKSMNKVLAELKLPQYVI